MARKNRSPEENARREKIRELLQMANIGTWMTSRTCSRRPLPNGEECLDEVLTLVTADWYRTKPTLPHSGTRNCPPDGLGCWSK